MIKDQNIDKTTKSVLAIISLHKHATGTTGTNLMMVGVPFDCKVLNATITTMSSTSATGTVDIIALTAATGTAGVSIFSSANTVAGTAGAYLDASPNLSNTTGVKVPLGTVLALQTGNAVLGDIAVDLYIRPLVGQETAVGGSY